MNESPVLRAVVVTRDPGFGDLVCEVLAAALPSMATETVAADVVRPPVNVAAIVLDAREPYDGAHAADGLRRLRACGFSQRLVAVVDGPDRAVQMVAARLGASVVVSAHLATELAPLIIDDEADTSPAMRALRTEMKRTQRLLAAGEIAVGLQHALNNPLAGLLAESQLLEMEPLAPEQRAAVRRIVDLCRRTIILVRQLDGVGRATGPVSRVTPITVVAQQPGPAS
jgi:signal transduction histidine kinase